MKKLLIVLLSFVVLSATQVINAQDEPPIEKERTELSKAEKDSIMYNKLDAKQILELKRMERDVEMERINASSKKDMPLSGMGIVLIVLFPFAFVIFIIYLSTKQKNIESKRKYELYLKSLEMGQSIPEHFFDEPKQSGKASYLQRGIIALMVGLSFGLFVIIKNNTSLPFLLAALIPSFVGIGYLIIHFIEKPKQEIADNNDEQLN